MNNKRKFHARRIGTSLYQIYKEAMQNAIIDDDWDVQVKQPKMAEWVLNNHLKELMMRAKLQPKQKPIV